MRQGKRPTRRQKIMLKKFNLNPENWLVVRDYEKMFLIVNRYTRILKKYERSVDHEK